MKKSILFTIAILAGSLGAWAQPGMMPKSTCTPEPSYHFKGLIEMSSDMVTKGKDTMHIKIKMYVNPETSTYAAISEMPFGQGMTATTITNMKDSHVVMLMDMGSMKTSSCHKMSDFMKQNEKIKKHTAAMDFSKLKATGKTKTILGHTCNEFKHDSAGQSLVLWIAPDLKEFSLANGAVTSQSGAGGNIPESMKGMALEMTMIDTAKEFTMHMMVKNIDKEATTDISSAGYTQR